MLEDDSYRPIIHRSDSPDVLAQALKGPLSPSMLTHVFGNLTHAVILADDQRRILYANRAAEELFGYPEKAMLGKNTAFLYADPDDYETQGFNRYNIHSSKDPDNYRVRYCQADGTHFLGLTTGGPIRSEDGKVWGFIGIIQPAGAQDSSLDTLHRLHTLVVNNSLDPESCAAQIIDLGREHFGSTVGLQTRVIDELFQVERCVDSTGRIQPGMQFDCEPLGLNLWGNNESTSTFHTSNKPPRKQSSSMPGCGFSSYIGSTIVLEGKIYGTLVFANYELSPPYSRDDQILVQMLSDAIAYSLSQSRWQARLMELAHTDELTGLPNRRQTLEFLNQWILQLNRSPLNLTVVSLDLDYFKRINDQWGHSVGDKVLVRFAETVRPLVRENELCGRIGGEEFLLILPDTDSRGGHALAERLRLKLHALQWAPDASDDVGVSISGGIACLRPGESANQLLTRADRALYHAKKAGRNQICSADSID